MVLKIVFCDTNNNNNNNNKEKNGKLYYFIKLIIIIIILIITQHFISIIKIFTNIKISPKGKNYKFTSN